MASRHRSYRPTRPFVPPTVSSSPEPTNTPTKDVASEDDEEEEDYMTMAIPTVPSAPETTLQRTRRLKAEALARGLPPSKESIATAQELSRVAAQSTSLFDRPEAKKSKGLKMMAKMGFKEGSGLGKDGVKEPVRVEVREGRAGIRERDDDDDDGRGKRRKVVEEEDKRTLNPLEYRDRLARERQEERVEAQIHAAQKLAQTLHEEACTSPPEKLPSKTPLLWRRLVLDATQKAHKIALKTALQESLASMHNHATDINDDDRLALGQDVTPLLQVSSELDIEDPELTAFESLKPQARLNRLLIHLRDTHSYCMWCKSSFPTAEMDGCPGVSEEDHE